MITRKGGNVYKGTSPFPLVFVALTWQLNRLFSVL